MHELREKCKPDLKYSKFYGLNFEVANEAAYTATISVLNILLMALVHRDYVKDAECAA
jgi:hypothetical protein